MGERFRIGEIVHSDEFDLGIMQGGANHIAANTAEAVDAYFDGH